MTRRYTFGTPRMRQTREATKPELQQLVRELAEYLDACGMDECAEQLLCRAFGDPPDAAEDPYGGDFLEETL